MNNDKRTALITGATSGIGRELAKLFAKDGYDLVIVARDETELANTSEELKAISGCNVTTIAKDLFKMGAAQEVYNEVKDSGAEIDVLVNDAGQGVYGLFVENDLQREIDIIHLNVYSVVVLTKFFLKDMVARNNGKILNVTSIAGKTPGPYQAIYHATKAFAHSFTEALHSELEDTGVTITSLLPGVTDTDFFNKADMQDSKAVQDKESMADPATVAKDGYDALMAGKDMVISGFMNKVQMAMGNVTPDHLVAAQTKKKQEPVNKEE